MRYALALAAPLFLAAPPLLAQGDEQVPATLQQGGSTQFELFAGAEYQEIGLANGEDLEKVTVPLTARLSSGRLRVTGQVPYVRVTGPGNVVPPSGPLGLPILVGPTAPAERTTREGIGDARLNLSYDLGIPGIALALKTGAKIPTASTDKGLGTGEFDYWAGADVSASFGAVTPFAGITYTKMGDPEGFDLDDTLSGQAGAVLSLGGSTSAHLGYSYSEATSEAFRNEQRVFGGINTGVGRNLSLGVYGSAGVAGPADVGAGVSVGIGFR